MAVYGYARCSTNEEKQDLERQCRELITQGAEEVFCEYVRGTAEKKPEQERLFAALEPGDAIAVTEVSRLARSVHQLCHIEDIAREKRVKIKCGALYLDYTKGKIDPMNRAMLYMMGTFAELERGVTVERIISGLENAKAKGVKGGRPRKTAEDVPQAVRDLIPAYERGEITASELARRVKLSRQVIYKYFALLGIGSKPSRHMTAAGVPQSVRELYPQYKAGDFGKSEFARRTGYHRDTIRAHIALLDAENEPSV